MTLSRKAVRPAQTNYLLSQNFLPVSLDYRLCPEIGLVEGPISDIRDAYRWARTVLPGKLLNYGVLIDATKIVVIGWSSGGQLAMSLAWTTTEECMPPPVAILSFYAPVDFESGGL